MNNKNVGVGAAGCSLVVAVAVVLTLLVACSGLVMWGWQMYEDEVCDHLGSSPGVTEELGTITRCEANVVLSSRVDEMNTFIYDLEGTRTSGRAWVTSTSTGPGGTEEYEGILLEIGDRKVVIEGSPPTL